MTTMSQATPIILPPSVILLNAFPGVGKLTTAKALHAALWPDTARLIDNHLWLDLAYAIVPNRKDTNYTSAGNKIRRDTFKLLKDIQDDKISIIMTNVLSNEIEGELEAFAEHADIARARRVGLVLVSLICNEEENRGRVAGRDVGKFI